MQELAFWEALYGCLKTGYELMVLPETDKFGPGGAVLPSRVRLLLIYTLKQLDKCQFEPILVRIAQVCPGLAAEYPVFL